MSPQQSELAARPEPAHPGASISVLKNETEKALADLFAQKRGLFIGSSEIAQRRDAAFGRFSRLGLPNRRVESWHYTDLRGALKAPLPMAVMPDAQARAAVRGRIEALRAADTQAVTRLVVLDGMFDVELSTSHLPAGLTVNPTCNSLIAGAACATRAFVAGDLGQGDAVVALNEAFSVGGIIVEVAPGAMIDHPVEVVFVSSGLAAHAIYSRSALLVGDGGIVRFFERRLSHGRLSVQRNETLFLDLGDRSIVRHVTLAEREAGGAVDVATTLVRLGADAELTSTALQFGAGLRRRQIFARLDGAHARCSLRGVGLLRGDEHCDTTIVMEHVAPGCESRETFNHIVDGDGTGIFQGKVTVAAEAQKTDGKMKSRAILLSEGAAMYNKPELEIFADDVTCGHGATCGSLDDNQLFYAQSRGIPKPEAEALLLEGFAGEILDDIGNKQTREALMDEVRAWLAQRGQK